MFIKNRLILSVTFMVLFMIVSPGIPLAEDVLQTNPAMEQMRKSLSIIAVVVSIPVLIAIIFILRAVYRNTLGKKFQTTIEEDYKKEAEEYEKAGRYVPAASIYEKRLKDMKRAAVLYEKGCDLKKAADLYNAVGMSGKAKELYVNAGDSNTAAEISMMEGEFEEAARIYDQAGKKIDAALAMERAGRKMAAVRAYREAGEYKRAAEILENEGMIKESVEMLGFVLRDKKPDKENIDDFYAYAFKLEHAGEKERAAEVYRQVDKFDPTYRDVRERLNAMTSTPQAEADLKGRTSLRGFMKSGSLEPKNSLKLWLQILKRLQASYQSGTPYGIMSPDNILIDDKNNFFFIKKTPSSAYIPPEKSKDAALDERSDIYSLGVILFEMLTGSLDGLGLLRIADIAPDLPEWLDDMVIRCIRKVREDRYQSLEAIFSDIKVLSRTRKD